MADTLDELMTDEALGPRPGNVFADTKVEARNDLRAELRPGIRALRESHDALVEALKAQGEMSGAFWHVRSCNATPWLYEHCAFYCVEARAALAKAEALGAVGAGG